MRHLAILLLALASLALFTPASSFCVNTGGTLVISDTGSGEVGTCVYDSGLAVDEWSLYRLFSGLFPSVLDW